MLKEKIIALVNEGKTYTEIARETGYTAGYISLLAKQIREEGLGAPSTPSRLLRVGTPKEEEKTRRVTDVGLVAYLTFYGFDPVTRGMEQDSRFVYFLYKETPELVKTANAYLSGASVPAVTYAQFMKRALADVKETMQKYVHTSIVRPPTQYQDPR